MDDNLLERCPAIGRLRRGYLAACEIESTLDGHRAWIGVYPIHSSGEHRGKGDYRIRVFEVDEKYLINDNDVWNEVMIDREDTCVFGEDNLVTVIERYTCATRLGAPQDCDYPV